MLSGKRVVLVENKDLGETTPKNETRNDLHGKARCRVQAMGSLVWPQVSMTLCGDHVLGLSAFGCACCGIHRDTHRRSG